MIQRIAVFAASLAAVAALVVGLSTAGFAPGAATVAATATPVATSTDPAATPQVQVDTVYVDPPQKPATVVVHKTLPAAGGEHENESEGSGD